MNSLRDIVPEKPRLEGGKVKIDDCLNRQLVFTGWVIAPSKKDKGNLYMILQFEYEGKKYVIMTGSVCLIQDIQMYEAKCGGQIPFTATIAKKDKAYVFK